MVKYAIVIITRRLECPVRMLSGQAYGKIMNGGKDYAGLQED